MNKATTDQVIRQVNENYIEEAIPLVIFNDEKKIFELNEEGRQHLEGLKQPLGIVAVAGMYRTGKSYLLNRMLLDRSDGFGVGPTINPCTKGVWMWGKPIEGLTPEGDPINVIILDTEGLGALDEDSNHDVRIFSLAILLSSFFIYNSVGSIDENALQNLSLVINLTKHIQIKSSGISEDIDPEEFAKYFPSFMWVVRDFTLQLVDQEGEQISPKDYLEKALQNQKGFSDSVEQKNRIRRLLKSFFTERDCVTMIRPLTNEDRLQNLISIPLNELRPEFVEQVLSLRRKVLQRVKPKRLNGKNLNGAMFWNLVKSYVESINKGAIPSIESSWSYICKNECIKAMDDAYDVFTKALTSEIDQGGPFYENELKEIYESAKKQALLNFQKIAVGEVKDQFLDDLKEKMKQKFNQIKQDNDQSCEQECIMFLRQSYTEIERALKNLQYPSFIDYLHDMEQFKQIFDESGPPGTQRKEILLDFCLKAMMESAEFFMQNYANEINLQRQLAEEQIRKLQSELQEIKSDQKERLDQLDSKLRKSEIEKAELTAKEQSSREALQQLQREKQELESEMMQKNANIKKDYERQIEELNQKMTHSDEQKKEIQRQQVASESEFDKQRALLDQKIEFLEKALDDSNKREKELSLELKNSKKDFLNQNREQTQLLEKQIKDQIKQIDDMKEQIYDWETKCSDMELQMEELKNNQGTQLENLQKDLQKTKDSESDINKKLEQLKKKYDQESQNFKNSQENDKLLTDQKLNELESQLKDTQESFEMSKQKWIKEEAVLKQRVEFVQYQLEEEKKKSDEQKQAHDSMLKSLQSSNRESVIGREEAQIKINEMEQKFINERKKQEEHYNEIRKRITDEVEQLKKKNNELELQLKIQQGDFEKEVSSLKEQLIEAEQTKNSATKQLKNFDTIKIEELSSLEEKFRNREKELENTIEEKDKEIEEMISENNERSEQQLNEIKRFYEEEKSRLERRIQDEKARFEKKLNQCMEDYEDKIKEITDNHDEAYNALEDEKNAVEQDLQNLLNQSEKETQVMQQQLDNKERYLIELKESYNNLQNSASKQNDQLAEKFSKERKELNEKIEQLSAEISKRDRSILSLENIKEGLIQQSQNKEQALNELKDDFGKEKNSQISKIEELKQKYDKAMDELTQSKIDFEREKALKDQRLQFQEQRIKEYHDQMQQTIERYEERLKQEKEEAQKMLTERIARIQQEKESVETKYEQKRKALKELEKNIQQSASQNERERAVQIEKYQSLEKRQHDLIVGLEIENKKLQEQNDQLNDALSQGDMEIRVQLEQWKSQYYEMERQHADLQSELEKEKALWEGKFEFLEKQKDQAKKDNEEHLKNFQSTVEQLQKSQQESKSKHDHNQSIMMQNLESKFKKDMKDAQEQSLNQINQLNSTIRRLEKENKVLNERLELGAKNSMNEQGGLEKKLERTIEERDRLKDDLENIKTDRDRKLDEMKRNFEREKEVLKLKNNDLQQKSKNTEARQTELKLAHETDRAKWDQEKSYLLSAKEDAISELKNIQRKYENSVKENERLKEQQKRNNWRMSNKERVGGLTTNNPMMYKLGENVLGRLNLGGAGQGLNRMGGANDLTASQSNLNLPKGEMGTFRSQLGGVDKSIDNFKSGFSSRFGTNLGLDKGGVTGGLGSLSQIGGGLGQNQTTFGAVAQAGIPSGMGSTNTNSNNNLDNSMRQSNILSTPSSKGGPRDDDDE